MIKTIKNFNLQNEKINYVDLGGTYVGPTQNRILRLIDDLGLQTYAPVECGDGAYHRKVATLIIIEKLPL